MPSWPIDVPGPVRPVEHGFMRRCGFLEAAVYGLAQQNSGPNVADADKAIFGRGVTNGRCEAPRL